MKEKKCTYIGGRDPILYSVSTAAAYFWVTLLFGAGERGKMI